MKQKSLKQLVTLIYTMLIERSSKYIQVLITPAYFNEG